jgi:hypothetical protein
MTLRTRHAIEKQVILHVRANWHGDATACLVLTVFTVANVPEI